ncbi:MAG TPA: DUF4351 domain-containing protein [Pirellulales bacterium]
MSMPKERRIELASEALERIVHCPENSFRRALLCECVTAYLPIDQEHRQQFEDMLRYHPDPGVQAMSVGLLDDVKERGRLEGKLEGKLEGMLEGQRELLRKQLEARFGPLPASAVAQLQAWPSERLTELGCALLSAASFEDLGIKNSAELET